MVYRNKTYVAFDADTDMEYYRLLTAWSNNDNLHFEMFNAHDLNSARDSSLDESIKHQLAERMKNSKLFIILIGDKTKSNNGFVKWEIEHAKRLKLPIIAVNLNGSRHRDDLHHRSLDSYPVLYVSFKMKIICYAMEYWPNSHKQYLESNENSAFYYSDKIYSKLGL